MGTRSPSQATISSDFRLPTSDFRLPTSDFRLPSPVTSTHTDALAVMRNAVASAAAVCSAVQARLDSLRAITKDDKSPVTIADFASQAIIARALRAALGDDLLLVAEETSAFLRDPAHAAHLDAALTVLREVPEANWPRATAEDFLSAIDAGAADPLSPRAIGGGFFTLDPIDGTKGFLRGGQYAIALAFVKDGHPQLAVMGCPNLASDRTASAELPAPPGCVFAACRGAGFVTQSPLTIANAAPRDGHSLTPAIRAAFAGVRSHRVLAESVESAHSDQSASAIIMREVDPAYTLLRLDSQCKYAVVARGQADLYLRLPSKKGYIERIWDHAAGALIAQEAGCTVTDALGAPLDFSRGRGLESNKGIAVAPAGGGLHASVIAAIRRHVS